MKVIIMRGIPGAGKSTYVRNNSKDGDVVVSTDSFFTNEKGEYNFDPYKFPEAHGRCLRLFVQALDRLNLADCTLWVDNTNITVAEIAPYYALAEAYGCDVHILTLRVNPKIAGPRNIHGVPESTVMNRACLLVDEMERFPSWWRDQLVYNQ